MSDIWNRLVDRIRNEPAVFFGSLASLVVAAYVFVNPTGDKGSLITTVISVGGPFLTGILIRPKVSPV